MIFTGLLMLNRIRKEERPDYSEIVKNFITMAFCETMCWVTIILVIRGVFR